jgi:hypothetical protein
MEPLASLFAQAPRDAPMTPEQYEEWKRLNGGGAPTQITVTPPSPPPGLPTGVTMDQYGQAVKANEANIRGTAPPPVPEQPKEAPIVPAEPSFLARALSAIVGPGGPGASATPSQPLPPNMKLPERQGVIQEAVEALPTPTTPVEQGVRRVVGAVGNALPPGIAANAARSVAEGDLGGAAAEVGPIPGLGAGGTAAAAVKGAVGLAKGGVKSESKKVAANAIKKVMGPKVELPAPASMDEAAQKAYQQYKAATAKEAPPAQPAEPYAPIGEPTTSRAHPPANFSRPLMGEPDPRFPLRGLSIDEAIQKARLEEHLMPGKRGKVLGAPAGVQSPESVAAMRAELDRLVQRGSEYGSEEWYPTARGMVTDLAKGDAEKAPPIAYALGAGSKGRSPEASLDTLPKMHNAYLMGRFMGPGEHPPGVSQDVWLKYRRGIEKGEYEKIGPKIDPYTQDLDPTKPYASTAVNDRWHGRAFGYKTTKGDEWSDAFSPEQHRYMDAETLLATDRANAAKFKGRNDWRPDEIQAMIWVAKRGESEGPLKPPSFIGPHDPNVTINPEMYPQYQDKHTFMGTSGIVPGTDTNVLPHIQGSQQARDAYAAKAGGWADPDTGHDILFDSAGMITRPSLPMRDIYGGDVNTGEVARALVGLEGSGGKKQIDQASLDLVRYLQARRGYTSQQNMSAGSVVSDVGDAAKSKGTSVIVPSKDLSPQQATLAEQLGGESGLPSVVHYGDRTMLTDFGASKPTITQERAGDIGAKLSGITGVQGRGRAANMISTEGADYSGDVSKLWGQPAAVTDHLLQTANNVPIDVVRKIDADPRVLADTQRRLAVLLDEQAKGGHVPDEVINAMQIMAKPLEQGGGVEGLINARNLGLISLPVVGLLIAPHLMLQGAAPMTSEQRG